MCVYEYVKKLSTIMCVYVRVCTMRACVLAKQAVLLGPLHGVQDPLTVKCSCSTNSVKQSVWLGCTVIFSALAVAANSNAQSSSTADELPIMAQAATCPLL